MAYWVRKDISKAYAAFRPSYPKELFDFIGNVCATNRGTAHEKIRTFAIDVGCGTGQGTVPLTTLFDRVVGVDPSPTQIEIAIAKQKELNQRDASEGRAPRQRIEFVVANATNFDDVLKEPEDKVGAGADLITVFQAAHWFDIPKFAAACTRVARKPSVEGNCPTVQDSGPGDKSTGMNGGGGLVALVSYMTVKTPNNLELSSSIASMDTMLHENGFWPAERKHIDEKYASISNVMSVCGWELCSEKTIAHRSTVSVGHLISYFKTWSSLSQYQKAWESGALDKLHPPKTTAGDGLRGMDLVLDQYILSVLRRQMANENRGTSAFDTANHPTFLDKELIIEFPVFCYVFKQKSHAAKPHL